uniref:Dynein heavy chain ATP-binding dynein motor region domain-containing protein n=1 Tax=Sinocyclocheilus rhinocerous TaxID=307959 RepID=A0A673HSY8_9TELE
VLKQWWTVYSSLRAGLRQDGFWFLIRYSYIKIGDKECEYNPSFRLILHTKLANPHYQPELQAQCTLVNFTVTRDGLEDQLLNFPIKFFFFSAYQHFFSHFT